MMCLLWQPFPPLGITVTKRNEHIKCKTAPKQDKFPVLKMCHFNYRFDSIHRIKGGGVRISRQSKHISTRMR